jgi:hypothetical protein
MKKFVQRLLATVVVSAAIPLVGISQSSAAEWQTLFDGTSTSNLRGFKSTEFPAKGWAVEKDTLRCIARGGGGDLVSRETYTDFELRFDWKVSAGANSGVMYRVAESATAPYETGPEYQVTDDAKHPDGKNPKTSAAALYALIACNSTKALKPVGQWNKARIVVKGNHVEHWLNKAKVVEYDLNSPELTKLIADSKFKSWPGFAKQPSGHICFQDHGDDVWFRKIKIRKL